MRILAILPLALVACTSISKITSRGPSSISDEASAKLGVISPELKQKLLEAVEDMLNAGNGETHRGQLIMSVNVEAIGHLRFLGVPEAEIEKKVVKRLQTFLEQGRREGLALAERRFDAYLAKEIRENGISADTSAGPSEMTFLAKYDLTPYQKLRAKIGWVDRWKMPSSYYAGSADEAFDLAMSINNTYLADQIIYQAVQLDEYEAAYKKMEEIGDNSALLTLGFLQLVDYYSMEKRDRNRDNIMWDTIETFKRVQGPLKAKANRIMVDLALDLVTVKDLKNREIDQNKVGHALRLLRSTGELIARVPIDSVKFNYITKVNDPEVVKHIRRILPMSQNPRNQDVIEALAAIGAKDMISRIALSELLARHAPRNSNYQYKIAMDLYAIADNDDGIRRVLDEMMGEKGGFFESFQISGYIIPQVLRLDGVKGLDRVKTFIDRQIEIAKLKKDAYQTPDRFQYLKENLEKAIASNDFSEYKQDDSRTSLTKPMKRENDLVKTHSWLKTHFAELKKQKISADEIAKEKKLAQEALAKGEAWAAFNHGLNAMATDELILSGDALVKERNGTNAIRPYMAAIVLEQAK